MSPQFRLSCCNIAVTTSVVCREAVRTTAAEISSRGSEQTCRTKSRRRCRPNVPLCARKQANRDAADYIYEQYSERGADFAQGPCDWHEGESCDMAGADEAGGEHMTCVTAGIPCVDSSTMNQHACGDGGRAFLRTSTFIAERKMFKEDWMWLECTWRWNCGLLQEQLPNSYKVHRLHMRGSDIGDI